MVSDEIYGKSNWKIGLKVNLDSEGGFIGTPPILVGSNILISTYEGEILLINAKTGKVNRTFSTGENIRSQPIANKGWSYVGTVNGKLIAINTEDSSITGWPMLGKNVAHSNN